MYVANYKYSKRFTWEDNFSRDHAGIDIVDNNTGKRYHEDDIFDIIDLLNKLYNENLNLDKNNIDDHKIVISLDALQELFKESKELLPEDVYNIRFMELRNFITTQQELNEYYKKNRNVI